MKTDITEIAWGNTPLEEMTTCELAKISALALQEVFGFGAISTALEEAGYQTLADVLKASPSELIKIKNIGRSRLFEITRFLGVKRPHDKDLQ